MDSVLTVSSTIIIRAMQGCQNYLDTTDHKDIDMSWNASPVLSEKQWSKFLRDYYKVFENGAEIKDADLYVKSCEIMLKKLQEVNPQMFNNRTWNTWIVKPDALSQGRGITLHRRLDNILKLVENKHKKILGNDWIVQKYIELPFLVYGVKVDVRQWFLVSKQNPLTVWFYKKAYVRFSTQPYLLKTLERLAHICNNALHKNLKPTPFCHPEIPRDNTWCCHQFQNFLESHGKKDEWRNGVVPAMKKAIILALLTAQDKLKSTGGNFELFGADFVLGEDLRPWLLEFNSHPSLSENTAVTATLCPAVQRDTLRVVLDRRLDPSACTGDFELIYDQTENKVSNSSRSNFNLKGVQISCTRALQKTTIRQKKLYPANLRSTCTRQQGLGYSSPPCCSGDSNLTADSLLSHIQPTTDSTRPNKEAPVTLKPRPSPIRCRTVSPRCNRPQPPTQGSEFPVISRQKHLRTENESGTIRPRPSSSLSTRTGFRRLKPTANCRVLLAESCRDTNASINALRPHRPQIPRRSEVSSQTSTIAVSSGVDTADKLPLLVWTKSTSLSMSKPVDNW